MKEGVPSRTAAAVCACRGFAAFLPETSAALAPDPMAIAMVDSPMLSRFERLLRWLPRAAARALFAATFPLGFYSLTMEVTLRAYAIDDIIRKFVASGGRQIVILGAGLDTRALRLAPELPDGTIVVEVDHPASATAKQAALKKVGAELPPHLRFHASDLSSASELDALPQRLKCLGLDPKRPTLTIMEGLIMYLPPAAVDRLLDAVAAFSAAPGSEIAMNYITEADRKRFFTPPRLLRPRRRSLPPRPRRRSLPPRRLQPSPPRSPSLRRPGPSPLGRRPSAASWASRRRARGAGRRCIWPRK